jgi:3-phosphoshikimate 1-carboxyvinyltransferase
MNALATSGGPIRSTVSVPGSKSIANRALAVAAMADGESTLVGLPSGDDVTAMISGLEVLGCRTSTVGDELRVVGVAGCPRGGGRVDAMLAGTTSRFLTAVAALGEVPTVVDGGRPLRRRPMTPLHDALRALGFDVEFRGVDGEFLPVAVSRGASRGGRVSMRGDVSSQFVSALMMVGPMLDEGVVIELTTPLVSVPYVRLTAAVMSSFGIRDVRIDEAAITVAPGRYAGVRYAIEPDASSASYPWAAAAITGGEVEVVGLRAGALQGDVEFLEIARRMGCRVVEGEHGARVEGPARLLGVDVDMADCSDLVPTVAAMAAVAEGPTRIRGVGFIRNKESDRIGDLSDGLRRMGSNVIEHDDGLEILPGPLSGARLAVHHDHRLAMAWSLVALVVDGVSIDDPNVVSKSWPEWWETRATLLRAAEG